MNWRSYLRTRTRQPEFLWRMVAWILAVGVLTGYAAQELWQPDPPALVNQQPHVDVGEKLDQLAQNSQWRKLWWAIPQFVTSRLAQPGPVALAVLTGICWLIFLLQVLQIRGPKDVRLWLALAALALGVLSIWPTHFFSIWQRHVWDIRESDKLLPGLRFYILGVGLREELAKLLCLLPLMPLLRRLRSDLVALIVSACVGLGFAATENISYLSFSGGAAMGRFLLANPMHFTLTGLIGLACYRALRDPAGWGPHALATFGLMVVAHGGYDAALALPMLAEYGLISMIIFALVVYQFFHELRELRSTGGDLVSLSATFLCGVSLVAATMFVYMSATIGCATAFDVLVQEILSLAVMVYLFLREMPETMVRV